MSNFKSVRVSKGNGGWGSGLTLTPTEEKNIILSVTNGGIHPVAARIAELTGATAVDGFTNHVDDANVLAAVINCGGTARIGVYPKKRIPTVDVFPGEPSGPLAQFITDDIFVSDVGIKNIALIDDAETAASQAATSSSAVGAETQTVTMTTEATQTETSPTKDADNINEKGFMGFISKIVVVFGGWIGYVINTLLSSGRQALQITMQTIIPFMIYVSLLIGIVTYTGISDWIAQGVTPLASNPFGLILLGIITAIPFLSPILGPGAAIAQVVGVLMGTQIAEGHLPVAYALPTLFAINGQVGCDFVPVGLSLGEAKAETISVGVPAVLFSRLITSPIAVIIAYFASLLIQ